MSSSNIIRQHEFQPRVVLVKWRSIALPPKTNGAPPSYSATCQEIEEQRQDLLEQASRQAEELVAQAKQEADLIRERAHALGEQEGYRDGLLAAEASCQEAVQTLARLTAQARIDACGTLRNVESQVVELALTIARKVVERELTADPTTIAPMVRAALEELADAMPTRVRVHPDCLPLLVDRWRKDDLEVELVGDPELSPGDCVVDTHNGVMDARVEIKFEEIAAALRGVRKWKAQ